MKTKLVVYGTSDHLVNFAEAWLVVEVAKLLKMEPVFFYYPKSEEWRKEEERLFYPCQPPSWDIQRAFDEAGLPLIKTFTIPQMIIDKKLEKLTLQKMVELIRGQREIKSFRIVSFPSGEKPVYASSKDQRWEEEWRIKTVQEVMDLNVKIGGSLIYFIYGYYLASCADTIAGILPIKRKFDVLNAFEAGESFAGNRANLVITGEFDFMTKGQWLLWEKDKQWRKAPAFAMKDFFNEAEISRWVRDRLFKEKMYTPLVRDEEKFYLYEPALK